MAVVVDEKRVLTVMANGPELTERDARTAADEHMKHCGAHTAWSFTKMERLAADTIEVHYT